MFAGIIALLTSWIALMPQFEALFMAIIEFLMVLSGFFVAL